MPITLPEHIQLWERIQAYSFDEDPTTPTSFLSKLCKEQNWTCSFAKQAIEEYKRFVFLCCVRNAGTSPSYVVDQVWHLHLTYTKPYWHHFCPKVLQKELHHYPSNGKAETDKNLQAHYLQTMETYHSYFDELPTADIWPNDLLNNEIQKINNYPLLYSVLLGVCGLLFSWLSGATLPFSLDGEHFLFYYVALMSLASFLTFRYMNQRREKYEQLVEKWLQKPPTLFQLANHLYGAEHGMQTALLNLMDNGLLVVTKNASIEVGQKPISEPDLHLSDNPFKDKPKLYAPETELSHEQIKDEWFQKHNFEQVILYHLMQAPVRKRILFPFYFIIGIGLIRLCQGIINDKPISYLVLDMLIYMIVYYVSVKHFADERREIIAVTEKKFPITFSKHVLAPSYALNGRDILFSVGYGTFIAATFPWYNNRDAGNYKRLESNFSNWNTTGSSSCGSSSGCSSGNSCGGGCGGCGGGD